MRMVTSTLLLAALLCAPASAQEAVVGQVIGFQDTLSLRVGDEIVHLGPGSPGYAIPAGIQAAVLAGKADLLVGSAFVKAGAGDAFVIVDSAGRAGLRVVSGVVEAQLPDGTRVDYAAGQFLPAAAAAALPAPYQPPMPAAVEPPPAAAPEAPPFDPLEALGRAFSGLSQLSRPEFKVVFDVHPYYKLEQMYDSNIYMTPPNRADGSKVGSGVVGSWITTNNLGLNFKAPLNRRHMLDGGYDASIVNYARQASGNNTVKQAVSAGYGYDGLKGVKARLSEKYLSTTDPAFSELVGREHRYQNNLDGTLDISRSRYFTYGFEGGHGWSKYINPDLAAMLNRWEAYGGLKVGVKVQPKTQVYTAYRRSVIHYTAGRAADSKSDQIGLGLDGTLTSKLKALVDLRYDRMRFDAQPAAGPKSVGNMVGTLQVNYKPSDRTNASLAFGRTLNVSTFANNDYYVATTLRLNASHTYHKVTFGLAGAFETDRYKEPAVSKASSPGTPGTLRRDDLYSAGFTVDWRVRNWMALGTSYQHMQRNSIFSGEFNYVDHHTAMFMKLSF